MKQTTTTYDEALRAASKYYEGNETAACQWIETCALKDASGHLPEAMPEATLRRCAGALARIESKYPNPVSEEEIFGLLYPAHHVSLSGPMLAGLGNPQQSAPISDAIAIGFGSKAYSYHELLQADDEEVYLLRRGVALGHDLSRICPAQLQARSFAAGSSSLGGLRPDHALAEHKAPRRGSFYQCRCTNADDCRRQLLLAH